MATVYGIVKQNCGFVNVYSEVKEGTTFKIYFPRHADKPDPLKPDPVKREDPRVMDFTGNETILLVEDETAILKMTKTILQGFGYTVLAAARPEDALKIGKESKQIHLLMTDVVMPGMNGRDLAVELVKQYPELKCLFMSGYTANVIAHHGILDKGLNFINKPFSRQALSVKLREILDPQFPGSTHQG